MVSGHVSTQTRLYCSTGQHVWWSLALVIDASSAPRGPLTASFVSPNAALSLVPSRSPGTCSSLGLRDLRLLDDRLASLHSFIFHCADNCILGHSLLSIHSTIGGILLPDSLFPGGASRRCARATTAVCSQEEITSTSKCVRVATAVVANSSRARLRAPSTLSVSHLATHVPT